MESVLPIAYTRYAGVVVIVSMYNLMSMPFKDIVKYSYRVYVHVGVHGQTYPVLNPHCLSHTLELYTVRRVIFGGANFHEKSEKALRINFWGFNFHDSKPGQRARRWRCACDKWMIHRSRSRMVRPSSISLSLIHLCKKFEQIIRIENSKTSSAG